MEDSLTYTIVPSHDVAGKVDGVIIYAVDETEQRLREAEEERARLELIFTNVSGVALGLFDAQNTTLIIGSPRYLDMLARARRLAPEQLIGRTWQDLATLVSSEQAREMWRTVVEQHIPVRIPELLYRGEPGESESIWDYSLTPLMDSEAPSLVRFVLVTAIEITEQAQARKDIEQLDRLKDDFISMVIHELRTPLTTIQGNAQLVARSIAKKADAVREKQDEQNESLLTGIIQQVKHMSRLLAEMTDTARIRGEAFRLEKRENVDLAALVRQIIEQYRLQGHNIVLHEARRPVVGSFDEEHIEQVINNLLSNALKYTRGSEPVQVTVARQRNEAVIAIRDHGLGIPPEEQERIFERFYRAREQQQSSNGLGLGLYISREIVTQHGGRIWVESEPGQGSTFYVSLTL